MLKLPKRLPYEFALLAALALSSCDGPLGTARFTNADREQIALAHENFRRAAAASSAMVDRVERAESRLDDIEGKLNM